MKLIIASNNAHKLTEIKAILGGMFDEILSLREAGIEHETIEDGSSFMENAEKKAREIAELSGCCALADDSGICVDALGGAPAFSPPASPASMGTTRPTTACCWKSWKPPKPAPPTIPAPSHW